MRDLAPGRGALTGEQITGGTSHDAGLCEYVEDDNKISVEQPGIVSSISREHTIKSLFYALRLYNVSTRFDDIKLSLHAVLMGMRFRYS